MVQTNGKNRRPLGEGDKDKRKEEGIESLKDLEKKTRLIAKNEYNDKKD